ncbi:MAG: cupin domain-containing protein [Ornithinimicrobium sp.]
MTGTESGGRAGAEELSALARLISCDPDTFAAKHWARAALLSTVAERAGTSGADDFRDLFSAEAVDELLSTRALRTPFIRMAKNGTTLPESAYTIGGGVGAGVKDQVNDDAVLSLFADGATIVLQGLHRTWGPITSWSSQLAAALGHPVQVNAYITPAQSQGFADHYDVHDVFVLQVHGHKEWSIHEPVLAAPLRDQPWAERKNDVEQAAEGPPAIQHVLSPGDCLYLPRGFIHSAKALGGISIHLTVGVHGWTRHHVAQALLDQVHRGLPEQRPVRESLQLGVDVTDPKHLTDDIEVVRAVLLQAIASADAEQVARFMTAQARSAQRPEAVSPISSVAALTQLDGSESLRLREHLALGRSAPDESGQVQIRSRAGRVTLQAEHVRALDMLLRGEPVRVDDVAGNAEEARSAARILVKNGIAVLDSQDG